jgi:hypothetical protein
MEEKSREFAEKENAIHAKAWTVAQMTRWDGRERRFHHD